MISAIYGWRLGVVAEATDADRCVQQSPCGHEPEPQVDGSQGAAEVEHLIGDSSKARARLGWQPLVDFASLVKMMVDADLERVAATPRALDRLSTL